MSNYTPQYINVSGMDCTNCALTITKHLQKKGFDAVQVNFVNGKVSYTPTAASGNINAEQEIESLGYKVISSLQNTSTTDNKFLNGYWQKFIFCAILSLPLFIGHLFHIHFLMNGWVQLLLTTPVYIIGLQQFGVSAYKSVAKGIPNMNVLITVGASVAYAYSLYGLLALNGSMEFMFFETTATTITFILLGNYLEEKSIATTQQAINKLAVSKTLMANMIAFDNEYKEQIFEVEASSLRVGDLVLVKTGEQIPADAKILWGELTVNESIITGESLPIAKQAKDTVIGGSIVNTGTAKLQVTAVGENTVLNNIVKMVQDAQTEKPPVQQLADKISAIFVPAVLIIAFISFIVNYSLVKVGISEALLRSIAILVIACPCAMGLATPAAVAVGLGRAAHQGILFKNAKSLEVFKNIKQVVFDKTGTLTTGNFVITNYQCFGVDEKEFKEIVYSIEKFSTHPLAIAIVKQWQAQQVMRFNKVQELKGIGMQAVDNQQNTYTITSYQAVKHLTVEANHQIYVCKNNTLIGYIDLQDEIRTEAAEVINTLQQQGITTILLSGDKKEKCEQLATALHFDKIYYEKMPNEKLEIIKQLTALVPTAMVGDGINDAPALAQATVGISVSNASQIAVQSAQVILLNGGLKNLPIALGLGKHTYLTIKQNLFWALIYNVLAIPVAACGLLGKYGPTYGAIIMSLSDVILVINSLRLKFKRLI